MTWLTGNEQDYFDEWRGKEIPAPPKGHASERWGIMLYYNPKSSGWGIRIFGTDAAQVLKDPRIPVWLEECHRKFEQFCIRKETPA
jgi:hypothetical protein